jgi:hypothetical protein
MPRNSFKPRRREVALRNRRGAPSHAMAGARRLTPSLHRWMQGGARGEADRKAFLARSALKRRSSGVTAGRNPMPNTRGLPRPWMRFITMTVSAASAPCTGRRTAPAGRTPAILVIATRHRPMPEAPPWIGPDARPRERRAVTTLGGLPRSATVEGHRCRRSGRSIWPSESAGGGLAEAAGLRFGPPAFRDRAYRWSSA